MNAQMNMQEQNTQTIKQFIELMDADECLSALDALMRSIPPSAVEEAYERYQTDINTMEAEYWKEYKNLTTEKPIT